MIKVKAIKNDWFEFTPEFNGNKDCPKEEQITCLVKYITQAEQDGLLDKYLVQHKGGKKVSNSWTAAKNEIINAHVKDIKNVLVENEDGSIKEIKTMQEIYELPSLKGLYNEIANALDAEATLNEEERKN